MYMMKRKINVILILLAIIALLYGAACFYFNSHFMFNTYVNGIDLSFDSLSQANEKLNAENPILKIKEIDLNGKIIEEELNLKDLDSSINYDAEDILDKQNPLLWFLSTFNKKDYTCSKLSGSYDESKVEKLINSLYCMKKDNIKKPNNAHLEINDGKLVIVEESDGSYIPDNVVKETITKAIEDYFVSLDNNEIDLTDKYEKATVAKDDEKLLSRKKEIEDQLNKTITINVDNSNQLSLSGQELINLCSIEDNVLTYNEDNLNDYISSILNKYNESDYYYINRSDFKNDLVEALTDKTDTITLNWIEEKVNKLIEVIISEQTLYYYENDVLILSSPVVTGNGDITDATPTGYFAVTKKSTDSWLVGADYEEHVDYWIGFDETGRIYGFHDASWRDEFGGDIYLNDPSRGCVNMPLAKIDKLFSYIDLGTEVYIH